MSAHESKPIAVIVKPEEGIESNPFLPAGTGNAGVVLSGIGGWELGLQSAGWNISYSAETDHAKREILARHVPWTIYDNVTSVDQDVRNGLYVTGGLPSHECQGQLWEACAHGIYQSEARWVVVETVHTMLGHDRWPGAMGRLQRDLHDMGYTTLWIGTAFGSKVPTVRWVRIMVIGWPMGWGIPTALSALHAQVVLLNDLEVAIDSKYRLMHADEHPHEWMTCMGYPAHWMTDQDKRAEHLAVTSCPMAAHFIGNVLKRADRELTLTVGDTIDFQLRRG